MFASDMKPLRWQQGRLRGTSARSPPHELKAALERGLVRPGFQFSWLSILSWSALVGLGFSELFGGGLVGQFQPLQGFGFLLGLGPALFPGLA